MDNAITVIGNLTRDPEARGKSTPVTGLSVAVTRRWTKGHEEHKETSFFDVTCFGDLATNVARSCAKGSRVIVTGRLEQQSWTQDGERRSRVQIVADDVGVSLRFAAPAEEEAF